MIPAAESPARDEAAPVGGFFETHEPDGGRGATLLDAWTEGRPYAGFVNARSAFAALVAAHPSARIWLPAFLCRDLLHEGFSERVRLYGVEEGFEPDLGRVERDAAAGDLVLVPAWFGSPPGPRAGALAARRPDLRIVEDRAQALDAGPGIAGAWRLFSPRKLLGVADGGLLVAPAGDVLPPQPVEPADAAALWAPPEMRRADPLGRDNAAWHAANQAKERAMAVTSEAMTPASLVVLDRTSLAGLAAPRLRNWRALDRRLRRWSALPSEPAAPPLGYVLRLSPEPRDRLLRALHADKIFAAVHWPAIAGSPEDFPAEHQWTRELITLPCDHRYDEAEMDRVAARVVQLLA